MYKIEIYQQSGEAEFSQTNPMLFDTFDFDNLKELRANFATKT